MIPWFNSWVGNFLWRRDRLPTPVFLGFPCGSAGKESTCSSIPGLGRYPGEGKGYPLQYSGLENSMDCIAHGVAKELDATERLSLHFSEIQENDLRIPSSLWRCQTNPNQLAAAFSIPHQGDISSHLGGQHLMTGLWKGHLYLVNSMIGEKKILNFLKLPKGPLYPI